MKKLIFPAVAALTLGLASCSSDEVNPGNGGGTVNYAEGGYVRLSINMPSAKGKRATSDYTNDKFEDGLANEYAVKDATLVLFEGANEATATFHSAYTLKTSMEMVGTSQITSMTKIVKKTDDKKHTGNLYALVVLNNNDLLKVENTATVKNGLQVKNTAGAYESITGTTDFDAFSKKLSETKATTAGDVPTPAFASNVAGKGIFMTNSPLVYKPTATTQDYITLVDVTKSVYKTEKEAQNAPAADIYVERGVAKVTFSKKSSGNDVAKNGKGTLTGTEFTKTDPATSTAVKKVEYEIIGWNLDVTNQTSYLVRRVDKNHFGLKSLWTLDGGVVKNITPNVERFVGTNGFNAQIGNNGTVKQKTYYRPYWAIDHNYSAHTAIFNTLTATPTLSDEFEDENPQYCYENTFDVDNQKQNQTTRAVVAVKLKFEGEAADANLYVFNGDRSKLYNETDAKTRVQQAILHTMKGKANYTKLAAGDVTDITFSTRVAATGIVTVTGCKVKKDDGTSVTVDASTTVNEVGATTSGINVLDAVNDEVKTITMYEKGVAYYPIRIKHFGDTYTPWSADMTNVTAGTIYPDGVGVDDSKDNRYLGRYGVVRNNWYDLSVSDIKGVGTPVIPSTDNIPDDELYNYISVRINILSWAKRTQVEEL